jgi:putative transposase
MSDSMVNGRRFRTFNVIDDNTREALVIEIDTSLSSKRIIITLKELFLTEVNQTSFEKTMD